MILISIKYQNFCFENIIYLPSAVNVPLISLHMQMKMTAWQPALPKWRFYFSLRAFLYYEYQAWFNLKFIGKDYFVIFFHVKIRVSCPRAELPCRCLVHSVLFKYILNYM